MCGCECLSKHTSMRARLRTKVCFVCVGVCLFVRVRECLSKNTIMRARLRTRLWLCFVCVAVCLFVRVSKHSMGDRLGTKHTYTCKFMHKYAYIHREWTSMTCKPGSSIGNYTYT